MPGADLGRIAAARGAEKHRGGLSTGDVCDAAALLAERRRTRTRAVVAFRAIPGASGGLQSAGGPVFPRGARGEDTGGAIRAGVARGNANRPPSRHLHGLAIAIHREGPRGDVHGRTGPLRAVKVGVDAHCAAPRGGVLPDDRRPFGAVVASGAFAYAVVRDLAPKVAIASCAALGRGGADASGGTVVTCGALAVANARRQATRGTIPPRRAWTARGRAVLVDRPGRAEISLGAEA